MAVATLFLFLTRPSGFFLFESVAKVELSQSLELVVKPLPLAFVPSSLSSVDRGELHFFPTGVVLFAGLVKQS